MGAKARILVIDDDHPTVRIISLILERQGYTVHTASDGDEGLRKAREEKPDLIILDIMMPGMDGYQVCRRLKKDPATAQIAVLILTAKGGIDEEMMRQREFTTHVKDQLLGFDVGADEFMSKPVRAKELVERVESVLWMGGFSV